MAFSFHALLVVLLLTNFAALGTSRMGAMINVVALQGVVLGVLPLLHGDAAKGVPAYSWAVAGMSIMTLAIKAGLIPGLMRRAMREAHIRREIEPLLGFVPSLIVAGIGTGLAIAFAGTLPLGPFPGEHLLVSASFATLLAGFIVLTTRRAAITQVVGYLIVENGVYVFGLLLLDAMPFLVEVGVLLDLLVAVFVMGIILHDIQAAFTSQDTTRLSTLKE
jgi:hydrogenase-4 component E